jgi:hypothetical protein
VVEVDLKAEKAELARLDEKNGPWTAREFDRQNQLAQRIRLQERYGVDPDVEDDG